MKKLLRRLAIIAAPIIWREIQKRRGRGHHRHHHSGHRRPWSRYL